jgi:hypothetical protein
MHGVAPQCGGRVASPLLGQGAGGRSPGFPTVLRTSFDRNGDPAESFEEAYSPVDVTAKVFCKNTVLML